MTSRATVYNTLNWLKQEGMIKEVFEAGCVRFDPNTEHHHYFVCRKCGKVEDVECDLIGTVKICSLPASQTVEFSRSLFAASAPVARRINRLRNRGRSFALDFAIAV